MNQFEPELGQACFGQPPQKYRCPEYVEDALEVIRWLLIFIRGDNMIGDPFGNTGGKYECEVFQVYAYSWNEEVEQTFNFAWRDVRISWYKWLSRSVSINRLTTWDETREMLMECTEALLEESR